jgi:hypothetical protein
VSCPQGEEAHREEPRKGLLNTGAQMSEEKNEVIPKDSVIEISQVANGFIVRRAMSAWFEDMVGGQRWQGATKEYLVFRSMNELLFFLDDHFTHRANKILFDA